MGTNQIHDYNPGIAPNGLFWTMPIEESAIRMNLEAGKASLRAHDLGVPDFFDFVNSLYPGTNVPAKVSFVVRWFDVVSRNRHVREPDFGFAGDFAVTNASIEWSSRQEGFTFRSDAAEHSEKVYALIGNERNGVFFA